MLWFSVAVMLGLTMLAWWNAQQLKLRGDTSRLRTAYLAAMVCGIIGALIFLAAALIPESR